MKTVTTPDDILNRFTYHPPQSSGIAEMHSEVRAECHDLAHWLNAYLPAGREAALALTKLEEVMFWANAAIARHLNAHNDAAGQTNGATND